MPYCSVDEAFSALMAAERNHIEAVWGAAEAARAPFTTRYKIFGVSHQSPTTPDLAATIKSMQPTNGHFIPF